MGNEKLFGSKYACEGKKLIRTALSIVLVIVLFLSTVAVTVSATEPTHDYSVESEQQLLPNTCGGMFRIYILLIALALGAGVYYLWSKRRR